MTNRKIKSKKRYDNFVIWMKDIIEITERTGQCIQYREQKDNITIYRYRCVKCKCPGAHNRCYWLSVLERCNNAFERNNVIREWKKSVRDFIYKMSVIDRIM